MGFSSRCCARRFNPHAARLSTNEGLRGTLSPGFVFALYGACTVIFMTLSVFFYRAAPASLIVLGALLAGCGQKGPLVLPPQAQTQAQVQGQSPSVQTPLVQSPPPAAKMSLQSPSN
ncbi:MAG: hypothetical protein B7Y53_05535 [Halothiobacillus sp. 28-55-5]|nr:MAG: hypothetical protein B7Y53_05535 [Halothiobacillus sp. 28-55-5]